MAPSITWKYFKVNPNDKTVCSCALCNATISRGGKTAKTFTTSNMMNHLKKFHPQEMAKEAEALGSTSKQLKRTATEAGCSATTSTCDCEKGKVQATLPSIFAKKKLWDINDHRAQEVHYLIGEMIAVDLQPYSMTSDIGFQRLVKVICPNYNIPSRKYITENIIPDIFQKVKTKIKTYIQNASHISLTTDIWTASTNNCPFLSVTGHWLSSEFEQHRAVLRVVPFQGSHTGARISEVLSNVLEDYELTKKQIFLVLRDSGANMIAGVNNCGLQSQSCFIHTLQLSINESIFTQQAIKNIVTINRNIVKHFNHSAVAVKKLEEIQDQLNLKMHKLIQDVATRWNSTYYMLERNLEQRKALATYAVDNTLPTLSTYQWGLVEKIVHLLSPFEEITKNATKRESTTSLIIPTIQTIKYFLSKAARNNNFSGIITTVEELQSSIEKRFSAYLENKCLCLSSFIDPRFKMKFQRSDMVLKIKEWVLEALELYQDQMDIGGESTDNSSSPGGEDEDSASSLLTFSKMFNELASAKTEDHHAGTKEITQKQNKSSKTRYSRGCIKELDQYLKLPLQQTNNDPFLWWKNEQETLPLLSKLALRYLSAPASSVESERLFSTGGNIYEPARNRLCPENGEILMFLHYNLRVLKFDYSQ